MTWPAKLQEKLRRSEGGRGGGAPPAGGQFGRSLGLPWSGYTPAGRPVGGGGVYPARGPSGDGAAGRPSKSRGMNIMHTICYKTSPQEASRAQGSQPPGSG